MPREKLGLNGNTGLRIDVLWRMRQLGFLDRIKTAE